jgi:hypothetical protein
MAKRVTLADVQAIVDQARAASSRARSTRIANAAIRLVLAAIAARRCTSPALCAREVNRIVKLSSIR